MLPMNAPVPRTHTDILYTHGQRVESAPFQYSITYAHTYAGYSINHPYASLLMEQFVGILAPFQPLSGKTVLCHVMLIYLT